MIVAAKLQTAIDNQQVELAMQLVDQLAHSRSRVRVYASPAKSTFGMPLPEDSLLACVTFQTGLDRLSLPVRLVMPRAALVCDLKSETLMAFDLPQAIQRCIVNGRLTRDDEMLGDLADEGGHGMLEVRTYLSINDPNQWPADLDRLRQLKNCVLAERQSLLKRSATIPDELGEASANEEEEEAAVPEEPGWCCPVCTFQNAPSRPGCEMCGTCRPENYKVPDDALAEESARQDRLEAEFLRQENHRLNKDLMKLMTLAQGSLIPVPHQQAFECPICLTDIGGDEGDYDAAAPRGIRLRECGHEVCSACLHDHALNIDALPVACPCQPCQQTITDAELAQLLTPEELARVQLVGLRQAEAVIKNAFHCVTPNCEAFVELADEINDFQCQICGEHNCVTCRASHKGVTCQQYQEEMRQRAQNDNDAKQSLLHLEEMLKSGEAMQCPSCKVFLQKKEGCDWLMCSVCRTEICWATKGPRWGPGGKGDTSGGCRCRVNKMPCHPQCMNCH